MTLSDQAFPRHYVPTFLEPFDGPEVVVDGVPRVVRLWDSCPSGGDSQVLRLLAVPGTEVGILCVDAANRRSLRAVESQYVHELDQHGVAKRALLVLKTDLRENSDVLAALAARGESVLTHAECAAVAERHGWPLLSVSALTGDGMSDAWAGIARIVAQPSPPPRPPQSWLARAWAAIRGLF